MLNGISAIHDLIFEIDHLHGDPVIIVVNGRYRAQLIIFVDRIDNGKIEVLRLRQRAGSDLPVLCLQADILVIDVIPGDDRGVILSIAAAVQIDADGIAGHGLPAGYLRGDVIPVLRVLQFVIVIQCPVTVLVFREFPESRIDLRADPLNIVAGVIAADQGSVVIHGIELISLDGIVPDAGINHHLLPVADIRGIRHTDLFRDVKLEIVVTQDRLFHQIHPGGISAPR